MKSLEKFFDVNMGVYNGVLVREDVAKKLAKLIYKQNQELKEFLVANIDALEETNWTLAYPNDEQKSVTYYNPNTTKEDILHRINLINKDQIMRYKPDVFIAKNMKDAERVYMEWFENTNLDD